MAFAPDERAHAGEAMKNQARPPVKFMKFTISRDSFQPGAAAGCAGLRAPPRRPRQSPRQARLGLIGFGFRAVGARKFRSFGFPRIEKLQTVGCGLGPGGAGILYKTEHAHEPEHSPNILEMQLALPPGESSLVAGRGLTALQRRGPEMWKPALASVENAWR
jgi:hypothetical protein